MDIWWIPLLTWEQRGWLYKLTYDLWVHGIPQGYPPGG